MKSVPKFQEISILKNMIENFSEKKSQKDFLKQKMHPIKKSEIKINQIL